MDRYTFRENLIYIESECRYLPQHENLDLLNRLTRELDEAAIEKDALRKAAVDAIDEATEANGKMLILTAKLAAAEAKIEKASDLLMSAQVSSNATFSFEKQMEAMEVLLEEWL